MGALWHPFSNMSRSRRTVSSPSTVARAAYVFDAERRRYLDATAGLWYANVGHGRPGARGHRGRQMAALASYNTFGDYSNEPAEALAEKLAGIAPMPAAGSS